MPAIRRRLAPKRLLPLLLLAFLLAPAAPSRGDGQRRVEPYGGIRWNDRIADVLAKMERLSGGGGVEVGVTFHDRLSPAPYGVRKLAPGDARGLEGAVAGIVRDYLAERDTTRSRGDDRLHRAFHLHVAGTMFDKSGKRSGFLDSEVRLTARGVRVAGVPFEMTATFLAHPGAGMTERFLLPLPETGYVLPLVLARVEMKAADAGRRKNGEVEAALGTAFVDGQGISVSWASDAAGALAVRYDAERFWTDGLDAAYREHLATVEGRSRRCHGKRAVDA